MKIDMQFLIQMFVYAITFGTMYGNFKTKLDYLEKKWTSTISFKTECQLLNKV